MGNIERRGINAFLCVALVVLFVTKEAKSKLIDADNEGKSVLERLVAMETEIQALKQNEKKMQDEIFSLKEDNHALKGMITEMKREHSELREGIELLKHENANTKKDVRIMDGLIKTTVERRSIKGKRQSGVFPAFTSYLDHVIHNLRPNQVIPYNRVLLNEGNAYNQNTGIFTAPVTGIYLFSWSTTARQHAGHGYDIWLKLVVNGIRQIETAAESRTNADDNQGSCTAIVKLSVGDEVWTAIQTGTDIHGADNERSTTFAGSLLYQMT